MTTNQDRAAEVIEGYYPPCRKCQDRSQWGIPEVGECGDCADQCKVIARALADAGLLAPDLPGSNHADEEGTLEWHIPDPNQPYPGIVRLYPNGHIRLVQINAPITSTTTALALSQVLAAAAYVQAHQEKK